MLRLTSLGNEGGPAGHLGSPAPLEEAVASPWEVEGRWFDPGAEASGRRRRCVCVFLGPCRRRPELCSLLSPMVVGMTHARVLCACVMRVRVSALYHVCNCAGVGGGRLSVLSQPEPQPAGPWQVF
jgi:hypothetical protein